MSMNHASAEHLDNVYPVVCGVKPFRFCTSLRPESDYKATVRVDDVLVTWIDDNGLNKRANYSHKSASRYISNECWIVTSSSPKA